MDGRNLIINMYILAFWTFIFILLVTFLPAVAVFLNSTWFSSGITAAILMFINDINKRNLTANSFIFYLAMVVAGHMGLVIMMTTWLYARFVKHPKYCYLKDTK